MALDKETLNNTLATQKKAEGALENITKSIMATMISLDREKKQKFNDLNKMLKKENNPSLSIHEVDCMSGATITANGLNDMMKNYLDCYLPFILKNKNLDETLISYNE